MVGTEVIPFFVIGIFGVWLTGPETLWLGEPVVVVVWGPLMVGGGYFCITGDWSWTVALASIPYVLTHNGFVWQTHR